MSGSALTAGLNANLVNKLFGVANFTCTAPTYSTDYYGTFNFASPQCGYVPNLGLQRSYTAEVWIKRSGNQTVNGSIFATPYSGSGKQINMTIHWNSANTVIAGIYSGTDWYTTPSATIPDNTWVRLVATYDDVSKTLSLFVDSETVSSRTASVTVSWDTTKLDTGLLIGRMWDAGNYFAGSMGYLRIYNRVLTGAELLQNYNATKNRFLTGQYASTHSAKYGTAVTDTFTVSSTASSYSFSYTNLGVNQFNLSPGFNYNTSNPAAPTLTVVPQLPPGTYYDTLTATDSNGSATYLSIKAIIAKADTLTIGFDAPRTVTYNGSQAASYPVPVFRGFVNSDTATVSTRFSSTRYASSATVPTNADTYTVSAVSPFFSVGLPAYYQAVVYETTTLTILKARQTPLNVSLYGGIVGSSFTITLLGGTDTGTVTESITAGSTATGCSVSNHVLTSTTSTTSYCNLLVTKAATQNYETETAAVSIYFLAYTLNQPSPSVGSGSTIALSGSTAFTTTTTAPPSITTLSTYSSPTGVSIDINGSGFSAAGLEVKFWRNKIQSTLISVSDTQIKATIPSGTTTGRIIITTNNGSVASDFNLQITP
jgi:hypothetical protein